MLLSQEWATISAWASRAMTSYATGELRVSCLNENEYLYLFQADRQADPVSMAFKLCTEATQKVIGPTSSSSSALSSSSLSLSLSLCVCYIFSLLYGAGCMDVEWVRLLSCLSAWVCVCVCVCVCVSIWAKVCLEVNYLSTRLIHPSSHQVWRLHAGTPASMQRFCCVGIMMTNFSQCNRCQFATNNFNNNNNKDIEDEKHITLINNNWTSCVKSFNFWLIARTWQIVGCCCTLTLRIIVDSLFAFLICPKRRFY